MFLFQIIFGEIDSSDAKEEAQKKSNQECVDMMSDRTFVDNAKRLKIDLFVIDGAPFARCLYILPYSLNVPFVTVTTAYESWLWRVPALPSYTPLQFLPLTEEMTFFDRLKNSAIYAYLQSMPAYSNYSLIEKYARDKDPITWDAIARKTEAVFINKDPVLDYAVPLTPNLIDVGGLTTKPAKSLPSDLDDFMSSTSDGVIVVSFGSIATSIPDRVSKKMADAFSKLDQPIIWKYKGKPSFKISSNVKLLDWIPQNDLLGHPKTKLFITHSGNNGQYEALYHGVPMLAFGLFGDQEYNAARVELKGFGRKINVKTFTADGMLSLMKEILDNKTYSDTIKEASEIYRSKPQTSKEKATFWLEHILRYGGKYLRSKALDIPLYQYLLLDVFAFVLFLFLLSIISVIIFINICCRLCKKKKDKQS